MMASIQNELSTIEEVIADAKAGKLFILVDDEDRENEGDLCVVAECATADAISPRYSDPSPVRCIQSLR